MCSSARTPKLQLVAEQPLAGECRIPSKKDTPHPRAKEKQDGRRGELRLESNPIPASHTWRAQTNLVCTRTWRPHRDGARLCLSVSCRGEGQQWPAAEAGARCSRPGCGISPLGGGHHYPTIELPQLTQDWGQTLGEHKQNLCAPRPRRKGQ